MAYSKLFQKILASSIWNEDLATKVVWITMLALKDQNQIVQGSIGGLAHLARVPIEDCRKALEKLLAPDPDDSSKVENGRRILEVPGGWYVVNGQRYRDSQDEDERRAWRTNYMREYRKSGPRRKQNVTSRKVLLTGVNTAEQSKAEQKEESALLLSSADSSGASELKPDATRTAQHSTGEKRLEIPKTLDTPEFRELWREYDDHCGHNQKAGSWSYTAQRRTLLQFERWGLLAAIEAMQAAITRGFDRAVLKPAPTVATNGFNGHPQTAEPGFKPDKQFVEDYFKSKMRYGGWGECARFVHRKLVEFNFVWRGQSVRDQEHAIIVMEGIADLWRLKK